MHSNDMANEKNPNVLSLTHSESQYVLWLDRLRTGDQQVAGEIIHEVHAPLLELVRRKFRGPGRRRSDPEDGLVARQYAPSDSTELWALLVVIAMRKCHKTNRYWSAQKRSTRLIDEHLDIEQIAFVPNTEFELQFEDILTQISSELTVTEQEIFSSVLEGRSVEQIAQTIGRSERTVQRVSKGIRETLRCYLGLS
jgi:DNA-directed RNA polymerase specialized sigma24 family protein